MVDRFSFGTPNKMVAFTALSAVITTLGDGLWTTRKQITTMQFFEAATFKGLNHGK